MLSNTIIMGNRTQSVDIQMPNTGYSRIVALDTSTLEPVTVRWNYEGDSFFIDADYFIDTQPSKYLFVTDQSGNTQKINTANINTIGEDSGYGILVAIKDDMTLSPWGDKYTSGEYINLDPMENYGVKQIIPGADSFVALREDGTVFGWGYPGCGGGISESIMERNDIHEVHNYSGGSILGGKAPYIETWGESQQTPPETISSMSNIKQMFVNGNGGNVLSTEGKVYAWSNNSDEALIPPEIVALNDIKNIYVNAGACIALRSNNSIVGWGISNYGGEIPDDILSLTDIDRVIPGIMSFTALRKNGSVVAWGEYSDGGMIPDNISPRQDIIDVVHCYGYSFPPKPIVSAYVALCADGSLCSWGGLDVITNVPATKDVVSLTCGYMCCCALKKDGSTVSWGEGINQSAVNDLLNNVQAVYAGCKSFVALKSDKTIVAWGNINEGADMSKIPADIQGNISYYL